MPGQGYANDRLAITMTPSAETFAPGADASVQITIADQAGNPKVAALGLTAVGFAGKFAAGFVAGRGVGHAFVGAGMVPRGEVGLVFAAVGRAAGALAPSVFAAVIVTVMATTFLAPPLLKAFRPKHRATAG